MIAETAKTDSADAAVAISPVWTLNEYRDLLKSLCAKGDIISLEAYAAGATGYWLRHDVELDLLSALEMGKLEASIGVHSHYFFCMASPLIRAHEAIRQTQMTLASLGHSTGLHVALTLGSRVSEQVAEARSAGLTFSHHAVSYHAPGLPSSLLAALPLGGQVYASMARSHGKYFSDSTGHWRWGDPRYSHLGHESVQVLTHPYWWTAGEGDDRTKRLDLESLVSLLPRVARDLPSVR